MLTSYAVFTLFLRALCPRHVHYLFTFTSEVVLRFYKVNAGLHRTLEILLFNSCIPLVMYMVILKMYWLHIRVDFAGRVVHGLVTLSFTDATVDGARWRDPQRVNDSVSISSIANSFIISATINYTQISFSRELCAKNPATQSPKESWFIFFKCLLCEAHVRGNCNLFKNWHFRRNKYWVVGDRGGSRRGKVITRGKDNIRRHPLSRSACQDIPEGIPLGFYSTLLWKRVGLGAQL